MQSRKVLQWHQVFFLVHIIIRQNLFPLWLQLVFVQNTSDCSVKILHIFIRRQWFKRVTDLQFKENFHYTNNHRKKLLQPIKFHMIEEQLQNTCIFLLYKRYQNELYCHKLPGTSMKHKMYWQMFFVPLKTKKWHINI